MTSLWRELRVAARCFLVVLGHPFPLVYPLLLAGTVITAIVGFLVGVTVLVTDIGPAMPIRAGPMVVFGLLVVLEILVLPVIVGFFEVAYCYEIYRRYEGHRPWPGAGIVVATRRLGRIALGMVFLTVGFRAAWFSGGDSGRLGLAGNETQVATQVTSAFLLPALAIEDGSLEDVAQGVATAVGERWGTAVVTSYGTRALGQVCVFLGIGLALSLLTAGSMGVLPFDPPFVLVLVLSALAGTGGIFLAIAVGSIVSGPVNTALYLYAVEGQVPDRLAVDVDDLAKTR